MKTTKSNLKVKDEACGLSVSAFIGLSRRMYSYTMEDKCIQNVNLQRKELSEKNISFDDNQEDWFSWRIAHKDSIRSQNTEVKTYSIS